MFNFRLHRLFCSKSPKLPCIQPKPNKTYLAPRNPILKGQKLTFNTRAYSPQNAHFFKFRSIETHHITRSYHRTAFINTSNNKPILTDVEGIELELDAARWRVDPNSPAKELHIDRKGLHPAGVKDLPSIDLKELEKKKGKKTPLAEQLSAVIKTRGPISLSTFMNQTLTNPNYGYYMKSDVFGKVGDFTTSPEISQMFGELLGLWCASMWDQLGKPPKIHIIELGPGRGTLSSDMLNATKHLKDFFKAANLHLVEVSPHLRRIQAQKFGLVYPAIVDPKKVDAIKVPEGLEEALRRSNTYRNPEHYDIESFAVERPTSDQDIDLLPDVHLQTVSGIPISWHQSFEDVPIGPNEPILIIAQEFFDAMPIYQFEYTAKGWRERLVDLDETLETDNWFKTTLAPGATPASSLIKGSILNPTQDPAIGDCIEVSADGMAIAQAIADKIAQHSGAALFIDYGYNHPAGISIRGIKDHKFVSIYDQPGEVDLSAMVDFSSLRNAALLPSVGRPKDAPLQDLVVYGPVGQGEFLTSLGIESRMATLLRKASTEKQAEELISAFRRLVDKSQMGTTYKVMGIFSNPKLSPDGFEVDAPVEKYKSELTPENYAKERAARGEKNYK